MLFPPRDVVLIESVFCIYVAPDIAIPQMDTRSLLHSLCIRDLFRFAEVVRIFLAVCPVLIKQNSKLELLEAVAFANCLGGFFHQLRSNRPLPGWNWPDVHESGYSVIVRFQFLISDFLWPTLLENIRAWFTGNVGVD